MSKHRESSYVELFANVVTFLAAVVLAALLLSGK